MQIRTATWEDKKELISLLIEFDLSIHERLTKKHNNMRAYKDMEKTMSAVIEKYLLYPFYYFFVVDDNGILKGYISGEIRQKQYKLYSKEGYIKEWFVRKHYRKNGIGKKLLNKLLKMFKKDGCTHIALDTHVENKEAIQLYLDMGFTQRLITFFKPLKSYSSLMKNKQNIEQLFF